MSQTLYRKYRPKNFAEVIGQEHVVKTLSNAVRNGRVGNAYLFTGPRGTGKTSLARILAKTVNCENLKDATPCEKCPACLAASSGRSLDIIEIDAASNTGVDNIRELRETVAVAPSVLKYKIYIIDEVHMLSTGAFNALLKTLEEPPTYVIFILATTEIHKVPETIISRCQRFDFSRLAIADIIKKLELIAKVEKVKIEKEALEMIAISAEGGMRDAESALGQIIALEDKNITTKEVEEILGTTDRKTAADIAHLIAKKDSAGAIARINELLDSGLDLRIFAKTLVNYLRQLMLVKIDPELKKHFTYEMPGEEAEKLVKLSEKTELPDIILSINLFLEAQSKISSSVLPQLPLEIAVIKATRTFPAAISQKPESYGRQPVKNDPASMDTAGADKTGSDAPVKSPVDKSIDTDTPGPLQKKDNNAENNNAPMELDMDAIKENWSKLLVDIRPYNHSLSALLSNCQIVRVEGNKITLATPYEFYAERLRDDKNRLTIEKVLGTILGCRVSMAVMVDPGLVPVPPKPGENQSSEPSGHQENLLDSALEIIGGRLVGDFEEQDK